MKDIKELLRQTIYFAGGYGMSVKEGEDKIFRLALETYEYIKKREQQEAFTGDARLVEAYLEKLEDICAAAPSGDESVPPYLEAYQAAVEMIVGGREQSDLESYGYDMVYAFTLSSINATMKRYVMTMGKEFRPEVRYYVYRQNPVTHKVSVEEATTGEAEILDSLDLFNIPDEPSERTPEQNRAVSEAGDTYKAAYAFRASYGIPEDVSPGQMEDILDFDTGETGNHTKVKYRLYFKDFSIIQWAFNPCTYTVDFSNLKQEDELWAFSFHVDLGLISVDDSSIPPEIRAKIHNIDPGSMFGIQQLFLDLNTTALQDFPTILGVSDEAMEAVNSKFVNVYFKRMRELGDVVFAYSIKPASPGHKPYILTPSDFKFYISPYYIDGKPSLKKDLYTLNYIVSCEKEIPYLKPFTWNWVDEAQYRDVNGAMAINKNRIYEFAGNEFSLLASRLLFLPYASMKIPNPIEITVSFGISHDSTTPVSFTDNAFHYSKSCSSEDMFFPIWGNIEIKYTMDTLIRTYQSEDDKSVLECRINTKAWLHVNIEGGVSEGTILDKTTWYSLKTSVDAYGGLMFEPTVKEQDNGATFEVSTWSKLITGDFDGMIKNITSLINNFINQNREFAEGEFLNKYNSNALWMLPGNQSLIFSDPRFSQGTDLTFNANYAMP